MTVKIIAILGMHRSGTSCLTGMLENAGLELGCVSRRNPYNKKGNNEHQEIVDLHEKVLAANNSSWNTPPHAGCRWNSEQRWILRELLIQHARQNTWGFKDPRTLFTLEGWLETVPDMCLIGSFRHPAAVAVSLMARGGGLVNRQLELWWLYNRRLLDFHDRFGFDLVNFDDSPEVYVQRVIMVAANLGLCALKENLTFFDPGLRTRDAKEIVLPVHVESLYQTLLAKSLR